MPLDNGYEELVTLFPDSGGDALSVRKGEFEGREVYEVASVTEDGEVTSIDRGLGLAAALTTLAAEVAKRPIAETWGWQGEDAIF